MDRAYSMHGHRKIKNQFYSVWEDNVEVDLKDLRLWTGII
jgi:hypothetical protein